MFEEIKNIKLIPKVVASDISCSIGNLYLLTKFNEKGEREVDKPYLFLLYYGKILGKLEMLADEQDEREILSHLLSLIHREELNKEWNMFRNLAYGLTNQEIY